MHKIDKTYWANLLPPLAPSSSDVVIFEQNIIGEQVILLGITKELVHLADLAVDSDPYVLNSIFTVIDDWLNYRGYADTYIGDGVLNIISMEDCNTLISNISEWSQRLIVRVFNEKTPEMRVAFNFPTPTDFEIQPTSVIDCEGYKFFIWDFNTGA